MMSPAALVLTLALAARPDAPTGGEIFTFDAGDDVEAFASDRFVVHFTRAGTHAVPLADADSDGVPDHVQLVAQTYEDVLDFYTGLGFRAPLPDDDGKFDVYLLDTGFSADGSFVAERCDDQDHCAGFMVEENDFAGFGYPSLAYANRLLASHEFFHAIQASYSHAQSAVISEGTAVWASEHFDPTLEDLEIFSSAFLDGTDRSLTGDGGGPVDSYTYGSSLFWEYLSLVHGDDVIRSIWEHVDDGNGAEWPDVIDAALFDADPGSTNFVADWDAFALATLALGTRGGDAGAVYGDEAANLPTLALDDHAALPFSRVGLIVFPASYVNFALDAPAGDEETRVSVSNNPDVTLHVVPLTGAGAGAELAAGAPDVGVPAGQYAVQIVNHALTGSSAHLKVCMGTGQDVADCLGGGGGEGEGEGEGEGDPPVGCGCANASAPDAGAVAGAMALAAGVLRRRRRRRV